MSQEPTEADRLRVLNDQFADALRKGEVHWCRARLLHAFAGAAKQGVLAEVLGELLEDDEEAIAKIEWALTFAGWLERPSSG